VIDSPLEVDRVALVGSGTIGRSWAVVFARAGIEARVYDSARGAQGTFERLFTETVDRAARIGAADSIDDLHARVTFCSSLEAAVEGVQYVQESVPETLETKRDVFEKLDTLVEPDVILASSASALPMTEIAARLERPERCLVVHPTNPPHLVPLVEIVPGNRTAAGVTDLARRFMIAIGQTPILVNREIFGFVLNRLQFALVREAFSLAEQGVASIEDIDRCITDGLGLRWAFLGPFGVEATNASSIREDLTKFRPAIEELIAAVSLPYALTDEKIEKFADAVELMFAGIGHDELVDYRDRMVAALRQAKDADPLPVAGLV
jgi:3-hydroxyacyl-CoA dehydrogenase